MSQGRKRITNLINGDVVIEDLGIRLPGKGSYRDVPIEAVAASRDLPLHARFVKITDVYGSGDPGRPKKMPFWPFIKTMEPGPDPGPPPSRDLSGLQRSLSNIEGYLRELLERPAPPHPEVLAAHLRSIGSRTDVPDGLPGAPNLPGTGSGDHPMFVPSSIVPKEAKAKIKVREEAVDKDDLDDGVAALRRARGKG